ncbi:MAG: hypothetical protein J3K34DRAFT_513946 [Monoraphidium minutum]|nr:MAG: hypothetical protein J3K34DRAFT_513946 [Monoraphidium minutum]
MDMIAEKLLHPAAEVRGRALQSLDFKLKYGLLGPQDLLAHRAVLAALLRLLSLGEGLQAIAVALLLLRKLAAADARLARALLEEGAEAALRRLRGACPPELESAVDGLAAALAGGDGGGERRPGAGGARRSLFEGGGRGAIEAPGAGGGGGGAASDGAASLASSSVHTGSWAPQWAPGSHAALPPVADPAASPGPPRGGAHADAFGAAADAPPPPPPPPLRFDEADARAARAKARADWRAEEALAGVPGGGPPPGFMSLPAVRLGAADDQHLFELNVRLQYSDDARLLLPALAELAGGAAADFPAEALLQRQSLLDNTLALLASPKSPRAVQTAAAELLLCLVAGLQRSLALARDPELSASAYAAGRRSGGGLAGAAAAAGGARPGDMLQSLLASVRGADPTCAASHPPLPLPPAAPGDAWRALAGEGGERVDVTSAVHSIVLQVLDLAKLPDRHFELLPIMDAALPLLCAPLAHLPPSDADIGGGACGPQARIAERAAAADAAAAAAGAAGAAGAVPPEALPRLASSLQAQWRSMLGALSRALASALAVARGERAAAAADGDGGALAAEALAASGLVAWDLCSANLLMLALRLINEAPPEWCSAAIVPPSIAEAAEAAALDEAACLLLPGLRPAARRVLAALRPAAMAALDGAGGAHAALAAADRAAAALPALLAAATRASASAAAGAGAGEGEALARAAAAWLGELRAALPALGQGPACDRRLAEVAVRGLAAAAAAPGAAATPAPAGEAAALLVSLLARRGAGPGGGAAQEAAYDTLLQLLAGVEPPAAGFGGGREPGPLRLALAPAALEHLVTAGLASPPTRRAAARALLAAMRGGGAAAAGRVLGWRAWVECYRGDPNALALADCVDAAAEQQQQQQQQQRAPGTVSWEGRAAALVRRLFSARAEERAAAGRELAAAVTPGGEGDDDSGFGGDPLRGLLDGGGPPGRRDPVLDAAPGLAANFTAADAASLLEVVHNGDLVPELRRSAAEQLLALAAAPPLLAALAEPARLEALWALAAPAWSGGEGGAPDDDAAALFSLQLPAAALALLFSAAARSPAALAWLTGGADRLLAPLLPLVFHPLTSMRRAAARLLAVAAFGPPARQWRGYARAAARQRGGGGGAAPEGGGAEWGLVPPGGGAVLLPAPFVEACRFPFRVAAVEAAAAPPTAAAPAQGSTEPPQAPNEAAAAAAAAAARARLVAQQRLLALAGRDAAAARRLLDAPPAGLDVPQPLLHATAATLTSLDASLLAGPALAAVASARSHAECRRALRAAQRLASHGPGLGALLAVPWAGALGRLLGAAPVTEDDQALWLELLPLTERMLLAAPWQQAQYAHLALLLTRSALPWLRARGAADDVGRPPLAALEAGVGEDELTGGGLAPAAARRLRLAVSRRALRVLLQLLRCARAHCSVDGNLTLLRALGGPGLLELLGRGVAGNEGGDAGCRGLAVAALEEALAGLRAAAALPGQQDVLWADASVSPSWEDGLLGVLEPLICRIAMPVAAHRAAGFRAKGLVRPALRCLGALQRLLPAALWSQAWAAVGGTFWLSRLARDREASIRRSSLLLLAALLAPGAAPTQRMLVTGWPDCGARTLRVAADEFECHGVRGAALAFVAAAAAVDPLALTEGGGGAGAAARPRASGGGAEEACGGDAAAQQQRRAGADEAEGGGYGVDGVGGGAAAAEEGQPPLGALRQLHRLGLALLLQQQALWESLPPLLRAAAAARLPPAAAAAACSLAALAFAADPLGAGARLMAGQAGGYLGPEPDLAAALQGGLPQPAGGAAGGGGGDGDEVDVVTALAQAVAAAAAAQRGGAALPAACRAHAAALEWLGGAGPAASEEVAVTTVAGCSWLPCPRAPAPALGDDGPAPAAAAPAGSARAAAEALAWRAQSAAALGAAVDALVAACAAAPGMRAGLPAPPSWADDGGLPAASASAARAAAAVASRQLPELLAAALCGLAAALPALAPPPGDACGAHEPARDGGRLAALELGGRQLAAASGAAGALAALLARLEPRQRTAAAAALAGARGPGGGGGALAALAALLEHPLAGEAAQQQLAAAVGCLMADEPCARALLGAGAVGATADVDAAAGGGNEGGDEEGGAAAAALPPEPACADGRPVGAALCASLARLVPSSFFIEGGGGDEEGGDGGGDEAEGGGDAGAAEEEAAAALDAGAARDQGPAGAGGARGRRHTPGQTACLVALRNLLAYSRSAKVAALGIGLHMALMDSCDGLGAALAAAATAAAAAGGGGGVRAARPGTLGAAQADTAAPDQSSLRASRSSGAASPGRRPGAAAGAAAAGEPKRTGTPLSLRRGGARRLGTPAGAAAPVAAARRSAAGAGAVGSGLRSSRGSEVRDEDAPPGGRGGGGSPAAAGARPGSAKQQEPGKRGGGPRDAAAARLLQRAAAARERRLLLCLSLLRHVAFRDTPSKEALADAGLLRVLAQLWPAGMQRPALLSELLALLAALAPGSARVRVAFAAPAGPRLPSPLALLLHALQAGADAAAGGAAAAAAPPAAPVAFGGAVAALLHFGAAPDGGAALAHPGCGFLPLSQKLLRGFLAARDHARAAAVLQALAAVAAAPEGRRALLRATAVPALLDLAAAALQAPHGGAVSAALLLLHNLSFSPDLRTPALANPRLLPLLLAAAESLQPDAFRSQLDAPPAAAACAAAGHRGAGGARAEAAAAAAAAAGQPEPRQPFVVLGRGPGCKQGCCAPVSGAAADAAAAAAAAAGGARLLAGGDAAAAAYAAGALWALMYQGEAVKAAVRKMPNAGPRLVAARAHCAYLLREAAAGGPAAAAVAARPPAAELEGSAAPREAVWWLRQLEESLFAASELLQQAGA